MPKKLALELEKSEEIEVHYKCPYCKTNNSQYVFEYSEREDSKPCSKCGKVCILDLLDY